PVIVCGLLPPQPHASFTRQGLSGPAPGHAARGRKSRRLPASQWPASPLRTSRCLILPRFLLTNGWTAAAAPRLTIARSGLFDLNNARRTFVLQSAARFALSCKLKI